eukprot:Awhi_evm1s15357
MTFCYTLLYPDDHVATAEGNIVVTFLDNYIVFTCRYSNFNNSRDNTKGCDCTRIYLSRTLYRTPSEVERLE